MSPKRRVTDGSDIWERVRTEMSWTSGPRTESEIAAVLRIKPSEVDRGLSWAYEEGYVGWIRTSNGIAWHRRADRKTIMRRGIFGETEACAYCYCAPHHAEGCIHGKAVHKKG